MRKVIIAAQYTVIVCCAINLLRKGADILDVLVLVIVFASAALNTMDEVKRHGKK